MVRPLVEDLFSRLPLGKSEGHQPDYPDEKRGQGIKNPNHKGKQKALWPLVVPLVWVNSGEDLVQMESGSGIGHVASCRALYIQSIYLI